MPGRSHRRGITTIELFQLFPDDKAAEKWFEDQRWPEGRFCPDCGSTHTVEVPSKRRMPYRCKSCHGYFSVRKGSVMQSSKLGLQKWAIAIYMMTTGLKGTSSMKLRRELGITQESAWTLMHRIREAFVIGDDKPLPGPVEADDAHLVVSPVVASLESSPEGLHTVDACLSVRKILNFSIVVLGIIVGLTLMISGILGVL